MIVPSSRPDFIDAETYSGKPGRATLARKLAGWINFTYARDQRVTPCDPSHYHSDQVNHGTRELTILSAGAGKRWFGTAYLMPSLSAAPAVLKVRFYMDIAFGASGTITLTDGDGRVYTVPYSRDHFVELPGSPVGWIYATLSVPGGTTLRIEAESAAGDAWLEGLCAWWDYPSIVARPYQPIPNAVFSDGRPLSAYPLRWLCDAANAFVKGKPRQVIAKWWGPWRTTDFSGSVLGRYRMLLGPHVSSVQVDLVGRVKTGTGKLNAYFMETGSASNWTADTPATSLYQSFQLVLNVPSSNVSREVTLVVNGDEASGQQYELASVSATESAPTSGIYAPGDTGWVWEPCPTVAADSKVLAADWHRLMQAMKWVWEKRGARCLVCDNRHNTWISTEGAMSEFGADNGATLGRYRVQPTVDYYLGTRKWRVRIAAHRTSQVDRVADPAILQDQRWVDLLLAGGALQASYSWDAPFGYAWPDGRHDGADQVRWLTAEIPEPAPSTGPLRTFDVKYGNAYANNDWYLWRSQGVIFEEIPLDG